MYQVSVVMPALNEEANIDRAMRNVIASFEAIGLSGEVVVVNDGSTDGTQAAVERWMQNQSCVQLVRHETPKGIGASFWDGVTVSRGEIVTMLPGDGENDAQEILRYLPLMQHVDIVVPFVYNTEVRSKARRWLSRTYVRLINLSFGMTLHYYNGTVLYRKSVFKGMELQSPGFFYQTELLIKTIRTGYLYAEVPYALLTRSGGRSKAVSSKSLLAVSRAYVSTLCSVRFNQSGSRAISPDSITASRGAQPLL